MSLVSTSKASILNIIQDTSQINYVDAEIWYYFNEGIRFLSMELAKINSLFANNVVQAIFAPPVYYIDFSSAQFITTEGSDIIEAEGGGDIGLTTNSPITDFLSFVTDDRGREKVFNATNNYSLMRRVSENCIDRWENETTANMGTPDHFYLRGNVLYVHPRPSVTTVVKFYYHPLNVITNDSSTIPWNGLFDNALERFVIASCRQRSEQFNYTQIDAGLFNTLKDQAFDIIWMRQPMQFGFAEGEGMF